MNARWAALAVIAALPIACSLSLGDFTGGTPPNDGGPILDAPVVDAIADGGTPQPEGGDGSSSFRCADHTTAVFCADFDEDPFDLGLDDRPVANGGTTSSSNIYVSPARSFLASMPAHLAANPPAASLQKSLGATTSFVLSYDVNVGNFGAQNLTGIGGLVYHGPYYTLFLGVTTQPTIQWSLYEKGDPLGGGAALDRAIPLSSGPKVGAFSHVTMRLATNATASGVLLNIDGVDVLPLTPVSASKYASTPQIYLGISFVEGDGDALSVLVDNVLVELP